MELMDLVYFIGVMIVIRILSRISFQTTDINHTKHKLDQVNSQIKKLVVDGVPENKAGYVSLKVSKFTMLKHEVINGVHYFFTDSGDDFVCQGASLSDAAKNFTINQGAESLGIFHNTQDQKSYCFVDYEYGEFVDERN